MLIIRTKEDNNKLSWVLRKNPDTSLREDGFRKKVSKGVNWGYYPTNNGEINPNEFHLRFIPYKGKLEENDNIEQFPIKEYTDPSIIKSLISSLLNSAWKSKKEEDGKIELEFFLYTNKNLLPFGIKDKGFKGLAYHIRQTFNTCYEGLNWLLALLYYLSSEYYTDDGFKKASINMNNANMGYYPRYLMVRNNPKYAPLFSNEDIHLIGGSTSSQRKKAVLEELKQGKELIDLGAGSLYISRELIPLYTQITAIDYSFEYKAKCLANEYKGKINLIETPIEEWGGSYRDKDVLLSEVLEHNPKALSLTILKKVLSDEPNKVVITLPNKEFNIVFNDEDDKFRHKDHHWEPTKQDLLDFLPDVDGYSYQIKGIGDSVKGINITWMIIYCKS